MVSDPDRHAVYLAEDRLARLARHQGPMVVGGRIIAVEPDQKFTSLAQARLFCTLTCVELGLPPVEVRLRGGEAKSHYTPATGERPAEIALASWGAWRLVVVHELTHHLVQVRSPGVAHHGAEFRAAMVQLLDHLGLSGQARELTTFFEGVGS